MADILMVIAPEDFRDEEYFHTREELEKVGYKISVASLKDVARSSVEKKEVVVDVLIEEVDVADYDALVLVGGNGAKVYFEDEKVLEMCYQTYEQGKVLGAICIAPGILARAGVLAGKKATSFASERETLDESGAITSDSHVVVDGQIVTADGPEVAHEFGIKVAEALKQNLASLHDESSDENSDEEEGYYPKDSDDEDDDSDDGFPENKAYYGEEDKKHEKRVSEEE